MLAVQEQQSSFFYPFLVFLRAQSIESQPKIQASELELMKHFYQEGSNVLEPLCCLRQSLLLCQKQKFAMQQDHELALLNLIVGSTLVKFDYGDVPQISQNTLRQVLAQFEEDLQLPEKLMARVSGRLSPACARSKDLILHLFHLQYSPPEQCQEHFNKCLDIIKQRIVQGECGSVRQLLKLLVLPTRNSQKQLNVISSTVRELSKNPALVEQALCEMTGALRALSLSVSDNAIYERERCLFFEFYCILQQNNKQLLRENKSIASLAKGILDLLQEKRTKLNNIDNLYHHVMIFRAQAEIHEKGVGVDAADIKQSVSWLENEILMPNRDPESFAYTYYQLSKLALKEPSDR